MQFIENEQTFLPTIILTGLVPTLSTILGNLAAQLTEAENYETHDGKGVTF